MARIKIDKDKCKGCRLCEKYCPVGIISVSDQLNLIGVYPAEVKDMEKCRACLFCAIICPDCCIEVSE